MEIIFKIKGDQIKFLLASGDWGSPSTEQPIGIFGPTEAAGICHELKYDLSPDQETWTYFMRDLAASDKWETVEGEKFPASLDGDSDFRELVDLHKEKAELTVLLRDAYLELLEHDENSCRVGSVQRRPPLGLISKIETALQKAKVSLPSRVDYSR